MAKNFVFALLFLNCFSLHLLLVTCNKPLVPALYVFGDSLSDSGNNNFLQTNAKVNFRHYGIDFPTGKPTGRFTNGKTFIDFIAEYLHLPLVPAYLGLSAADKMKITTGVNYASGAAGILPETGKASGNIISFDEQIIYFRGTVRNDLYRIFKHRAVLLKHLSESIFFVSFGNNDYINNYLQPANYPSSRVFTPQHFADLMIDGLRTRLTRLYKLGARKFIVFNVARLGCVPAIINTASPRPTTPCAEGVNNLVLLYNVKLPSMITALERTLLGSTFVRGDAYNMNKTSAEAGFATRLIPCCQTSNITGLCLEDSPPCQVRTTSIFWDAFHPTEVVNRAEASNCFNRLSACVPINVHQLALKK